MSWPVLLFAAGLGTRMAPLTNDRPKPLVQVAGKPLLDHALDLVEAADTGPVVVNAHYLGHMIRDHLAGRNVQISDEADLLRDTGGGLRHALPLLGKGPVVTMNTDAVWSEPNPVSYLLSQWRPEMTALLLCVAKDNVVGHSGKGDFDLHPDGSLSRGRGLIYSGLQIIRPEALDGIVEDVFSMNVVWDRIAARGGLFGATYGGKWCDVGQPQSIALAEAMCDV